MFKSTTFNRCCCHWVVWWTCGFKWKLERIQPYSFKMMPIECACKLETCKWCLTEVCFHSKTQSSNNISKMSWNIKNYRLTSFCKTYCIRGSRYLLNRRLYIFTINEIKQCLLVYFHYKHIDELNHSPRKHHIGHARNSIPGETLPANKLMRWVIRMNENMEH